MKESHINAKKSNAESSVVRLLRFIKGRGDSASPTEDLEAFERDLHELVAAVECEVMAEELARFDIDEPFIVVNGTVYHNVIRCEETYFGSAGNIRVERSLYSSRQAGERALCPMELRAGIIEGRWTPLAAKQASWVVAHLTPGEGEQLFEMLGSMKPSKSSLDRMPKKLSERWEQARESFEAELREQERVPDEAVAMAVSLDGVLVPMKDGDRQEKREQAQTDGKQTKGPSGYKEVGCGTVSFYDEDGNRLCTRRMARMPEHKKTTLKEMLTAEVHAALAERPDLDVVKMADGARDNWTYLSKELDVPGHEVVDFFHACEHLNNALIAAYGETHPKKHSQYEKFKTVLRDEVDGGEKVIRSLVHLRDKHPRRKKIAQELGYFRRNRHRMNYAELKDANLPIGTGVTEAACKTLATQRMKRSGMRWRHPGGQAILTFRSAVQSDRFDRFWNILAETYKADFHIADNVIPLHRHRSRGRLSA